MKRLDLSFTRRLPTANITLPVTRNPKGGPLLTLLGHKLTSPEGTKQHTFSFAEGKWVSPGGKTKSTDRSEIHAAQREVREETGLSLPRLAFQNMGSILAVRPDGYELWRIYIYLAFVDYHLMSKIRPERGKFDAVQWFNADLLPQREMVPTDRLWMPRTLALERLSMVFTFSDKSGRIIQPQITSQGFAAYNNPF